MKIHPVLLPVENFRYIANMHNADSLHIVISTFDIEGGRLVDLVSLFSASHLPHPSLFFFPCRPGSLVAPFRIQSLAHSRNRAGLMSDTRPSIHGVQLFLNFIPFMIKIIFFFSPMMFFFCCYAFC